ncbi:MAG: beta-propeller domain-containing protein, partial [Oscillospiraceae bacterium]|nr:beta-propeller domain-containing protein [Oscillospiraceae bacterium]
VDAYTYNNGWEFTNHTSIVRCAINGTELNIQAEGKVPGSSLNQYSMDEKDGFLRIVTLGDHSADINSATPDAIKNTSIVLTDSQEQSSALYVLNSQLKIVGKTKSVAEGEEIKSVRFDGDICYFVTFRNTDPLYTVDLADPQDPQIVGELKIPGFSEYMHPFGNNLLLGLGQEADIDDGSTQGVKLTMFDVADKTDVKVISNYLLPKDSYSFFANNHKGLFVDSSKQMFGFEYGVYNEAYSYHGETIFYGVYKFADGEFKCAASINLTKLLEKFGKDFYADYSISQTRGFYIDDYFYIVNGDLVCSFKLADFSPVQTVFNK